MMKKRFLSLFVALLLCAVLISAPGQTAEAAVTGMAGDNLAWSLDTEGVLKISGSGPMYNWTRTEEEPWFPYIGGIRRVEIGSGVTGIGDYAFFSCGSLEEVSIPSSVTEIGYYAFGYCGKLARLCFCGVAEQWAGVSMGNGNSALNGLPVVYVVPSAQHLKVNGTDRTTEVYNINGSNYFKLRDMAALLNGTTAQFSVGYDAAIGQISVSTGTAYAPVGGELAAGTDQSASCRPSGQALRINGSPASLTAYNLGGNNFFNLRDLGGALGFRVDYDAASQTVLVTSPQETIGTGKCGENVSWTLYLSGMMVIEGTGPMTDYPDVEENGNHKIAAPWNNYKESINSVVIRPGVTTVGKYAFRYCSTLASVSIPEGVVSLGIGAFADCPLLESPTLPSTLKQIEDAAFINCGSITQLTLPEGLEKLLWSSLHGTALTEAHIPASVSYVSATAFQYCLKLEKITVAAGNQNYRSVDGVLYNADQTVIHTCPAGKKVDFYAIPEGVKEIGVSAFADCETLKSVAFPSTLTKIGDWAFSSCKSLAGAALPDSVTSIGTAAFIYCGGLTDVKLPANLKEISETAFGGCGSLRTLTVPGKVTGIGKTAFSECVSLKHITLPASLTSLGPDAFNRCDALETLLFQGTRAQWEAISLSNVDRSVLSGVKITYGTAA